MEAKPSNADTVAPGRDAAAAAAPELAIFRVEHVPNKTNVAADLSFLSVDRPKEWRRVACSVEYDQRVGFGGGNGTGEWTLRQARVVGSGRERL